MRSDWDKELRTLQKWRDSASPIKLQLVGSSFTVQGWASIVRADDFEIALDRYFGRIEPQCRQKVVNV